MMRRRGETSRKAGGAVSVVGNGRCVKQHAQEIDGGGRLKSRSRISGGRGPRMVS